MRRIIYLPLSVFIALCSCNSGNSNKSNNDSLTSNIKKPDASATSKDAPSDAKKSDNADSKENDKADKMKDRSSTDCDPNLWKRVYTPERLQVLDKCITATGIIEESNADPDGDQHMLLKLDHGQKDLLTKRNKKKKDGNLVIEVVCANKITRKKAMTGACNGYVNNIQLPNIGDHVKVTGSYVIDSHNGWSEIHPVTKIEKIK